jgi:hypothetical protein
MSKRRPRPFQSFATPLVRIIASPIAHGFRYSVRPKGHSKVIAYTLHCARDVAHRFSRRIVEIGPPTAFRRRAG